MKLTTFRELVRESINEAKEEKEAKKVAAPKKDAAKKPANKGGKLVDMKKKLTQLKSWREELQVAKFAERTASTEVEYADLAKFAKQLDALNAGGVKLEADLDAEINTLEEKIKSEVGKIKEMIGMTPSAGQEKMVDESEELNVDAPEEDWIHKDGPGDNVKYTNSKTGDEKIIRKDGKDV